MRSYGYDFATPALQGGLVPRTTILLGDDNSGILVHVGKMLEKEKQYQVVASISDGATVIRHSLRLTVSWIMRAAVACTPTITQL